MLYVCFVDRCLSFCTFSFDNWSVPLRFTDYDYHFGIFKLFIELTWWRIFEIPSHPQALVSFKKYMPPPLPYFKVNICPFPLPHFSSIFFAYLWSVRWPNCIVTLPRYFSLRLPHLNIPTGPPSDELDKNISEHSLFYFYVIETNTVTSGLRWIFHMHSEFSRPATCSNALMIISSQM
jgi:hypothetical protein